MITDIIIKNNNMLMSHCRLIEQMRMVMLNVQMKQLLNRKNRYNLFEWKCLMGG